MWGEVHMASKYLGFYEEQIQKKIIDIQFKYNLNFLLNFGASDGYHIVSLIKNKYFKSGLAFEKSLAERKILKKNIIKNNLINKIQIFNSANFKEIFDNYDQKKIEKSLFLIDIEGDAFNLFESKYINKLKNSHFIIEIHDFLKNRKNHIKKFFYFLEKYFKIELIKNGSRCPFQIKEIKNLSDNERWLLVSEDRPREMYWIYCKPRKYNHPKLDKKGNQYNK